MKKIISFVLLLTLVFSVTACGKENSGDKETSGAENEVALDLKSVELESLITFTHSDGEYKAPEESLFSGDAESGMAVDFTTNETQTFTEVVAPMGIKAGDSMDALCESYCLQSGYGVYVPKGGKYTALDTDNLPDFSDADGGAVYIAYVEKEEGNWYFMDSNTIESILLDKVMFQGNASQFSIVLFAFSLNSENEIEHITQLYGNIKNVIAFVNQ